MLADMRSAARDTVINCGHLYGYACQLQIRSPEMGKSLAAILRLRDAARRYHSGVSWSYAPQSNWLRECSETLLDAWIEVEMSLPLLEPTPLVAGWWNRSQHSLVTLYHTSSPYIGQPIAPLPSALGVRVSETR